MFREIQSRGGGSIKIVGIGKNVTRAWQAANDVSVSDRHFAIEAIFNTRQVLDLFHDRHV